MHCEGIRREALLGSFLFPQECPFQNLHLPHMHLQAHTLGPLSLAYHHPIQLALLMRWTYKIEDTWSPAVSGLSSHTYHSLRYRSWRSPTLVCEIENKALTHGAFKASSSASCWSTGTYLHICPRVLHIIIGLLPGGTWLKDPWAWGFFGHLQSLHIPTC